MTLSRNARVDAALAAVGMTVFVAVRQMTGRIPVNDGRGWDGMDYAAMLTSGFDAGSANSAAKAFRTITFRHCSAFSRSPSKAIASAVTIAAHCDRMARSYFVSVLSSAMELAPCLEVIAAPGRPHPPSID